MIHMAWLAVSSFENVICVILSNISFSAFKEDEGKYKAVPQQERNVNALDFFKWSLVLASSLFILIINLLFSVYHIWKIMSYLRFRSWNWPTWPMTKHKRFIKKQVDLKLVTWKWWNVLTDWPRAISSIFFLAAGLITRFDFKVPFEKLFPGSISTADLWSPFENPFAGSIARPGFRVSFLRFGMGLCFSLMFVSSSIWLTVRSCVRSTISTEVEEPTSITGKFSSTMHVEL